MEFLTALAAQQFVRNDSADLGIEWVRWASAHGGPGLPELPLEFSDFLAEITAFIRTDERCDESDESPLVRV